jgi:hypothetical protein
MIIMMFPSLRMSQRTCMLLHLGWMTCAGACVQHDTFYLRLNSTSNRRPHYSMTCASQANAVCDTVLLYGGACVVPTCMLNTQTHYV